MTGLLFTGCHTTREKPTGNQSTATIPDRPEKLSFDPLNYEPPDPADYRVQLKSGPVAYVASDRELPLVNISVLVHVGNYLEPEGKEGLAGLTGYLLTRGGTSSRSADELEERLAYLAANLSSGVGNTEGNVNLNLLSKDLDEGLSILREVLVSPRFEEDKLALRKQQVLQQMQQRNDDSANIEAREREFLAFGEQFWSNHYETKDSIDSISRQDLQAFHRRWFHPSSFVVAASGDFDRDEMIQKLETLFANWPYQGDTPPVVPTNIAFAAPGAYLVNKEVNQGRVSILLPGVMRDAPDYFSVSLMNRILGGGGFTSRIMARVRSDEGLAYAASSSLQGGVYYPPPFVASFQTKSRTVAYATSIVLEEMRRMAAEPVADEELDTAKRYLIDVFPRVFASKAQTTGRFAQDEFTGRFQREPDYWKKYRDRIESVSVKNVQKAAQDHLALSNVVILVVGDKAEILKGHPDHEVSLTSLASGKVNTVPLRDPMTMKPVSE